MRKGVTTSGVRRNGAAAARVKENPARNGGTEGGKGRSDGPLPDQAQHAADHTRPKSMWWRETKRSWAVMRSIEQDIPLFVKRRPDAGHRLGPPLPTPC
ncbi:hypothetical protein GCM10010451_28000 [Streptomyces virens]|uniref:Uncharacterized protein n=1 Tax=Streptomyces virens TaxID=285572 RepID=A0ABP6PHH6_9ACTN